MGEEDSSLIGIWRFEMTGECAADCLICFSDLGVAVQICVPRKQPQANWRHILRWSHESPSMLRFHPPNTEREWTRGVEFHHADEFVMTAGKASDRWILSRVPDPEVPGWFTAEVAAAISPGSDLLG